MDNTNDDMAGIVDFIKEWESDFDYITAHTSGSTGRPKEIHLLKSDMRASARATNSFFSIDNKSVIASPLSVDYIAGKMMCVRSLEAHCRLLELPVSNKIVIDQPVDLLAVVPSQIELMLDSFDKRQWSMVRNIIIGGAPVSRKTADRIAEIGINAWATYGMTETCSHVALSEINGTRAPFRAMPGISFDMDSRGCLIINAPGFSFKTLVTNDRVHLFDSYSFEWIGRFDNIINSGGIKISPEQLEATIGKVIETPFYIVGVPDEKWGEVPMIVYEGDSTNAAHILELAASVIKDHRICPRKAVAVTQLPLTPGGKISRTIPLD